MAACSPTSSGLPRSAGAIVIVVRGGRGHAVPLAAQTRFHRDVLEHAASAIAVEPVPPTGIGFDQAGQARAVGEKEVQQPIAVVVQSGDSSQHGFDLMPGGRGTVVQHHIEPRTRACVFKPSGERGRRGLDHAGKEEKSASGKQAEVRILYGIREFYPKYRCKSLTSGPPPDRQANNRYSIVAD